MAVQPGFKPKLSPQQVKEYQRLYEQKPDQFNEETVKALEEHAEYYKVPFAQSQQTFLGKVGKVMKQYGAGFAEGYTTLGTGKFVDPPKDDAEAIGRNLGHLAGFVGWLPSPGINSKVTGIRNLARAAKAVKGTSIPLRVADATSKFAGKQINTIFGKALGDRAKAAGTARTFLQNNVVKDMASGAFHLGVASAVGSWRYGVDEMLNSFIHGAETGAVFRGIGNLMQTGSDKADKVLRSLSSSLYTGLPATMRGDTTPMQVYEYVLGAYFGYNEMPVHRRMGKKHLAEMIKEGKVDPATVEGSSWEALDKPAKDYVNREVSRLQDPVLPLAQQIVASIPGTDIRTATKMAKEYLKDVEKESKVEFSKEGEPMRELTNQELESMNFSKEEGDPQNKPEMISLNAKSFTENSRFGMETQLEGYTKGQKLSVARDLHIKWTELIKKARADGNNVNPGNEMVEFLREYKPDYLEDYIRFSPSTEARNFWKRLGFMRLRDEPVQMATVKNGVVSVMEMDAKGGSVNISGERKQLTQERKLLDEVYSIDSKGEQSPSHIILDHFARSGKNGWQSYDIGKYQDSLIDFHSQKFKNQGIKNFRVEGKKAGEEQYKKELARTFFHMHQQGYYYQGGRGDAQRMYFAKYHPGVRIARKNLETQYKDLIKVLKKTAPKEYRGIIEKSLNDYVKKNTGGMTNIPAKWIGGRPKDSAGKNLWARRPFGEARKNAEEMYKRAFVSNVIYDLRLNGFEVLKDGKVDFKNPDVINHLKTMKGKGFINNAKGNNKRAQIWLTSGYSADPKAVAIDIAKNRKTKGLELGIENDQLNIKLVKEDGFNPKEGHKLGTDALKYLEASDGHIIARNDLIDGLNNSTGLPAEGGVNKSFIVSPNSKYGALLGKYMFFSPTKKLNDYMEANNIHMIIPQSSAKQHGTRRFEEMTYKKGEIEITDKYKENLTIPIKDIKVVMSEITDGHYIQKQRLPKQMLTNLTSQAFFDKSRAPFTSAKKYQERMQEIIDDIYDSVTSKRIKGVPEYNKLVNDIASNPQSASRKEIDRAIANLDSVGVRELLTALKTPGNELFANKAYSKIQKINREIIEMEAAEEGHTAEEVRTAKREMAEFQTVQDRISRVVDDSLAGFLHKFSRDYRMAVMRNYIINGITRPEIENSGITRMRPYELTMANEGPTKKLRKDDSIFFLDDNFKSMMVDARGIGRSKREPLGELWKEYEANQSPEIKEFFRAVLTRVPMDSLSGANVLNFGGFTGVRGYGSLMHGRAMKALGGADLDGDKAWVFFGGQSESGRGVGFKKSWKDAYDWSRNEFIKNGRESDSKEAKDPLSKKDPKTGEKQSYRTQLTITDEAKRAEITDNTLAQYSPQTRLETSEAAYGGRATLGMAVTQTAAVRAAHSAIMSMPNQTIQWNQRIKIGGKYHTMSFEVKANSKGENMVSFRGVSRAAVGLGSDPMDEAGLNIGKYGENLMKRQSNALFDFNIYYPNGKLWKNKEEATKQFGDPLTGSNSGNYKAPRIITLMRSINSALYSRNWKEGRRFHMFEIQEKLREIESLTSQMGSKQRNTLLPKLASDLQNIDWSDGALRRVDIKRLDDIYIEHNNNLKNLDWLKDVLGRDSLAVMRGKYNPSAKAGDKPFRDGIIDFVLKNRLHKEGMKEQLDPLHEKYIKDIFNNDILKEYTKRKNYIPESEAGTAAYNAQRKQYLNDIVRRAEDFIINDMSDIASINRIAKLSDGIPVRTIKKLSEMADAIKRKSYISAKRLKNLESKDVDLDRARNDFQSKLNSEEPNVIGEKMTSALNQAQLDNLIRIDRANLTVPERNLYDAFLLSSLWTGGKFRISDFVKKYGEPNTQEKRDMLEDWADQSKKTTVNRVGYNSEVIPDSSVRGMLSEYGKLFKYSTEKIPEKEMVEKAEEVYKKIDKPQKMIDPDGNRIEGQLVEMRDMDANTKKYLNEYAPFVGLYEGKLNKEQAELALRIKGHLHAYGQPWTAADLNGFMRTLVNKDINKASIEDFYTLDRWFQQTQNGTWLQQLFRPTSGRPEHSRWHTFMFPKAVSQDLLRSDLKLVETRDRYRDNFGWVIGDAKVPENVMSMIQKATHSMSEQATQMYEEQRSQWDADIRPFYEGLTDGSVLWRIAVRSREKGMPKEIESQEKEKGLINSKSKIYFDEALKTFKEYNWDVLQEKIYDVPMGDKIVKMSGKEVVGEINKIITKWNVKVHGWMTGQRNEETGRSNFNRMYEKYIDKDGKSLLAFNQGHKIVAKDFIKRFNKAIKEGKRLDLSEGIDGIREISKSHQISMFKNADMDVQNSIRKFMDIGRTGRINYDYYWPHVASDPKVAAKYLKEAAKELSKDSSMTNAEKSRELIKVIYHYKQATGDFLTGQDIADPYNRVHDALLDIAKGKKKSGENVKFLLDIAKVGSQHTRQAHIPGWSIEPEVYTQYMKGVIDNMYKHAAQVKMRDDIHTYQQESFKKHNDPDYTESWTNFFRLYANESLGYPTEIPKKVLDNPNQKISGTPYAWFADSAVKNRINSIRERLGIGKAKDEGLPQELKGIDFQNLSKWSNMEAKYQLASLLAHPKSAVANLYGGTVHTLISTGYDNLKNARDIKYLQANVNKNWKSMEDVNEAVYKAGVIEDFLIHEAGLNPKFKGKKWNDFLKDAVRKIKKDPELKDKDLSSIAKKHGISDSAFNTAAWFMRRPERTLRRDSFMAHLLQNMNNFQGAISKWNDPTLMELAKKGVKSTQFLYSAPFRPAFARSSMGKVMTRFQLWSWNSVRFRNDVIREAGLRGFKPGTQSFERFKRMATADLMMLSLSSIYMYSLFESALPAPYNWFQDFADWIYGDEKERDRAFFGAYPTAVAPLQLVTPPSLRILPPLFKGIVNQDWDKLADYYIWTMFPFGRIARDVVGPGGMIDNPTRSIEKMTGLPYQQATREFKKDIDNKGKGPKGFISLDLKFGQGEEEEAE